MTSRSFVSVPGMRRSIKGVTPYQPGKFIEEIQEQFGLENVIKLASNENPYGPYANSIKRMQQEIGMLNQYPNSDFGALRKILSRLHGISPECICISHGAEGMLQTIGKCFIEQGDEVIIPDATYTLYKEISTVMGANIILAPMEKEQVSLSNLKKCVTNKTKLIWIANPNNPTGTVLPPEQLNRLLENLPKQTWVILDEAYAEFTESEALPDRVSLIRQGKPVIAIRTFSKAYGLAGARLGYSIASPEVTQMINTVSEPFNANRVAISGGIAAITEDNSEFQKVIAQIKKDRKETENRLEQLGMRVISSHANFIMFETPFLSQTIFNGLLEKGVIVRPCDAWGYDHMIRVSIGTPGQMDRFIKALSSLLKHLAQV